MKKNKITLKEFAVFVNDLLHSDRDMNIGVGGFTGEGKTTFSIALQKEYAKVSKTHWDFNRITWSRKELLKWIDGEKESQKDENGLKKGQLPEYSAILPDELFLMFYARNWYDGDQIDAIATFNMCRDRHIFLCGNVPDFWDLDSAFRKRIRLYVYIPYRSIAWVFQQENNPFSSDPWNVNENKKIFRKSKSPYKCPNFLFQVEYEDLDTVEKAKYLEIRNTKRVSAIEDNKSEKIERYGNVKEQRGKLITLLTNYSVSVNSVVKGCSICKDSLKDLGFEGVFTNKYIADLLDIDPKTVADDKHGRLEQPNKKE